MSERLARLMLCLYPLAHRRRYGEEMRCLLEDSGSSPRVVVDLLRGALAAHLRPASSVAGAVGPEERIRLGLSSVLLCWVLFAAAGLGLYKTTEGRGFSRAGDAHALLGGAHLAIQVAAVLGSAAVAIAVGPLVHATLRQVPRSAGARRAVALACGCLVVFILATAGLVFAAHASPAPSAGLAAVVLAAWSALGLACGIGCVVAARRGLAAISVPMRSLRRAAVLADLLTVAMGAIAIATGIYLVALLADAPHLAAEGNGPLGTFSVAASVAIQLTAMALAAAAAILSAARARVPGPNHRRRP